MWVLGTLVSSVGVGADVQLQLCQDTRVLRSYCIYSQFGRDVVVRISGVYRAIIVRRVDFAQRVVIYLKLYKG